MIPPGKKDKVIVLNPTDKKHSLKSNLIDYDKRFPEQKSLMINELFKIFDQKYDMRVAGGPMFELLFRNGMLAVMDEGVVKWNGSATFKDFDKFFWDSEFREKVIASGHPDIKLFFEQAGKMSGDYSWANWAPYITSKINRLLQDDFVSPFVATKTDKFDFRGLMDNGNILLIKLDKGRIGSENVSLFGQLLLNQISLAAMSRSDIPIDKRRQHFIFIDEFQNFMEGDTSHALSELRKYAVSLILANQTLAQLKDEMVESILGNVGSLVFFRPGTLDYERIKYYLEPEFSRQDVLKLPNFNCIARLMIDNVPSEPFVFKTIKD
jgi:hypothetical protein